MKPDELLHRLRLRGVLTEFDNHAADRLVADGLAIRRGTKLAPTAAGRTRAEQHARVHAVGLEPLFATFLALNAEFLALATRGQGADEREHWGLTDELGAFDDRAGALLRQIATIAPRFGEHRTRLRTARREVENGNDAWFVSPRIDSYHTVWMELHEDLLLALGRSRED